MIKMVCLDPPVRGGSQLRRYLNKVGLKSGYDSWFVEERHLPHAMIESATPNVSVIRVDGRSTLKSLKRALETTRRDLEC